MTLASFLCQLILKGCTGILIFMLLASIGEMVCPAPVDKLINLLNNKMKFSYDTSYNIAFFLWGILMTIIALSCFYFIKWTNTVYIDF